MTLGKEVSFDRKQFPGKSQLWEVGGNTLGSWSTLVLKGATASTMEGKAELCAEDSEF